MSYFIGVDIGSAFSKAVLIDEETILASRIKRSSGNYKETAEQVIKHVLNEVQLPLSSIRGIAATGYGANNVTLAGKSYTEVSSQAAAIAQLLPDVRTILDAGDMYCRAVRTDGNGKAVSFLTTSTCAGGSSRVLEIVAHVLHVELEQMGELSLKAKKKVSLNTGCAVFAETDVVSLISEGNSREDILAGLHRSLASQIHSLAERLGIEKECAFIGGGARNIGLARSLEEEMGMTIQIPDEPQIVAAYGAALLIRQSAG
jgi:predicted CoA-substrate-specific enzyme activase